jgi:hypothetical protein
MVFKVLSKQANLIPLRINLKILNNVVIFDKQDS